MQDFGAWLDKTLGIDATVQGQLVATLVVILVLLILRLMLLLVVDRGVKNSQARYQWRRGSLYVVVFLGLLILARLWFEGFQSILTFLGLLAAGLVVALGEVVLDFAAWLFIVARRPFRIGDRIQIGDHAGDVADIRIFQFLIMEIGNWVDADQSTGRLIYVPNSRVFREPLANYGRTFHYIWNEVPVVVTFESDWIKAKQILQGIADKHSAHIVKAAQQRLQDAARKLFIQNLDTDPAIYTSTREYGILLTLRYLCEPKTRRSTLHAIWEDILGAFAEHDDIDFAYPTTRIYYNPNEGKPGTIPTGNIQNAGDSILGGSHQP